MQTDQMNTAFLENSNLDNSDSDSQLDALVNPRPISALLKEMDRISELKRDLEAEENLNAELAKENTHLKQKIAKLEQQEFVQNKIDENRRDDTEMRRKLIQTLEEKNEDTSSRLRTAKVRHKKLKNEFERLKSKENEYIELEGKCQRLEEESNKLKHDLKTSNDANQKLQRQIASLQDRQVPPSNSCCNIS